MRETEVSPLLDSGVLEAAFLVFPYLLNSFNRSQMSSLNNTGWLGEYVKDE